MWICLNNAFLSVVQSDDPEFLMVRARARNHLVAVFGKCERIIETTHNDYRWRVIVPRHKFAALVADLVVQIDYGNFKSSVKNDKLHNLYLAFWRLHCAFQNGPRLFRRAR